MSTVDLLNRIQKFLDSLGTGKPLIVSEAKELSNLIEQNKLETQEIIREGMQSYEHKD
tara:strand:- start:13 stop:186 length:174 start_codon:yes stop_codon:yes gene_type:complete